MQNNPFAKLFADKFKSEVLNQSTFYGAKETIKKTALENKFMTRFNLFLERCGEKPIDTSHHFISDKKLAHFCSSLRFYMVRNIQDMPQVTSEFSRDKDLISLFDSAAQYLINRARQYRMRGCRVPELSDIYDYITWKVNIGNSAHQVKIIPSKIPAKPGKKNLFIFDPNRIPEKENLVEKLFHHDMQDMLTLAPEDTKIFFTHMPTSYPEEIAVANVLTTLRYPQEYNEADMEFAKKNWSNFLGKKLEYNEDNEIISGYRYEDQDFINNLKDIKIFGYCAGMADAHRCLKAFKELALQIYDEKVVQQALKNIQVMGYAMGPLEKTSDYSAVYFMSNDVNDISKPEHVFKTNFPELYSQVHITKKDLETVDSKITETQDGNFIVASPMPENSFQIKANGEIIDKLKHKNASSPRLILDKDINKAKQIKEENLHKKEWRDGHRLQNTTAANLGHPNHIMARTVFTNMLQDKTGAELFSHTYSTNSQYVLMPAISYAHRQKLKE